MHPYGCVEISLFKKWEFLVVESLPVFVNYNNTSVCYRIEPLKGLAVACKCSVADPIFSADGLEHN
jgi:hypothetical protein